MRTLLISLVLSSCLFLSAQTQAAGGVQDNSSGWSVGLSTGISAQCMMLQVIGVCIWIICAPKCKITIKIRIGHYNPEALVEISNPQGIERAEDPRRIDTKNRNHNNLVFQEAFALGHPFSGQIYCPSHASALTPYFSSILDAAFWRTGLIDMLTAAALFPGVREIGHWPRNTWGPLFPREGWTIQHSAPKASAIIAQRVGDIITQDGQSHVYNEIGTQRVFLEKNKFTFAPAKGVKENTAWYGWWQPLYPNLEQACLIFGTDDRATISGWGGGRVSESGEYAYALWRPYTCCEKADGVVIIVDWILYPGVT
ncbi:MAG TPA: hypothetical protein ENJ32_05500 [Crenotrichaceae bacterium]|nr:hypothetical protein [Crenotrichaceae bacterium]